MLFELVCDMKEESDGKGKRRKTSKHNGSSDVSSASTGCTDQQFTASGLKGKILHALDLTPELIGVVRYAGIATVPN